MSIIRGRKALTSINILINKRPNLTRLRRPNILIQQIRTLRPETPRHIHCPLQRSILPPKHVIAMLPKASIVARREHERLRAILGPIIGVVEARCIPDDLVHELRDAHGVRVGAGTAEGEEVGRSVNGVGYVGLMVYCVEVYTIPATIVR